jgi:hypothetical protein
MQVNIDAFSSSGWGSAQPELRPPIAETLIHDFFLAGIWRYWMIGLPVIRNPACIDAR